MNLKLKALAYPKRYLIHLQGKTKLKTFLHRIFFYFPMIRTTFKKLKKCFEAIFTIFNHKTI